MISVFDLWPDLPRSAESLDLVIDRLRALPISPTYRSRLLSHFAREMGLELPRETFHRLRPPRTPDRAA